jgi:hypothetical protein
MSRVEARASQYEGQSAIIKARVTTDGGDRFSTDGTYVPDSVTVKVFDTRDSATVLNATTSLAVATAFTANATGYLTTGWRVDSDGYNFLCVIPDGNGLGFNVPWEGAHTYVVEITIATSETISPGAQAEGPISFRVEIKVDTMLGVT